MEWRRGLGEFRDGWRLVVAAMLGTALGMPGLPFYTIGVFAPIMAKEFGWPFASIFFGLSLMTGAILIVGPVAGMLIDRFGTRLVSSISLPCFALSYMTLAASNGSLTQYYVSWAAIAVFGLGATPAAFTRAINRAFVVRRGLALGIVLSGTGLLAFGVKPLAQMLIAAAGWRAAILMIGAIPLVVATPLAIWGFPRRDASWAAGPGGTLPEPAAEGMTAQEAFRSRPFWLLAVVFIPMSLAVAAPLPNIENILRSLGLPPAEIVQLASMIGIAILAGRLAGGVLIDRFWAPAIGAVILTMAAIACLILSMEVAGYIQALVAVLLLGLTAGIEFDLMAYLVARYLGMRSYATTYAMLYGIFAVGSGMGPSLFGYVFDRTGSYAAIFEACVGILAVGTVVILLLGPYPSRVPSAGSHRG